MIPITQPPLKIVFFIHFVLSVWALQAGWLSNSYLYYNMVFLLVILWSLHSQEADEPVFMALTINLVSILLDCICIGVGYSQLGKFPQSDNNRFSLAMAIINLLLRPITSIMLFKIFSERSGRFSDYDYSAIRGFQQGPYENIDHPANQSVPKTSMDTGSPVHEHYSNPWKLPAGWNYNLLIDSVIYNFAQSICTTFLCMVLTIVNQRSFPIYWAQ